MVEENRDVKSIRKLTLIACLAVSIISALAVVFALLGAAGAGSWAVALAGAAVILLLCGVGLLVVLAICASLANRDSSERVADSLSRIETLLENQGQDIQSLASLACLSDQAKSLIYSDREIEALYESVHAMLLKQDYKSAEALLARMETQTGLTADVAKLRDKIEHTRQATVEEKIESAIDRIDKLLERFQWAQSKREADRLATLFPDNPNIQALPQRILAARNARKRQLLVDYSEACRINDVERSIELLKELDKYLTPQEGGALAESARDVFKKKLHNLGVQFTIAVEDQQWANAIATGEEIVREYPNSRMAREVKEKLRMLRNYATGANIATSDNL